MVTGQTIYRRGNYQKMLNNANDSRNADLNKNILLLADIIQCWLECG